MELFKKIRLRLGNFILSGKIAKSSRKVYYSNFSQVRNIGIVWDASRTSEFVSLSRFQQKMHEKKIEVKVFGYFPGRNLPDQYTAIRFLTCAKKDEINYFFHPVSAEASSFIMNPFDVLIDINFDRQVPLRYVTSLSNSRLKVGLLDQEPDDSPFDLMMELKKPVDLESYLSQIIHYLEIIKDDSTKTVEKN
jgi:Family of unknown function (DUF6913)